MALALSMSLSLLCSNTVYAAESENNKVITSNEMSEKQLSSLSMLNYMTVLTQEINASSGSKVYLDSAYSSIVNNINPNAVDDDTLYEIQSLLNTIEAYRSIDTRRERLQYLYEQNQAKAMQQAVPNPMSVLNVVQSGSPAKALVSVLYLAVDSQSSYQSYVSDVDTRYMQDGWQLDDEAAENLHECRKDAFSYMVEMCQKYDLNGDLALNEKSVENFVKWKNNSNTDRVIAFLEGEEETYQAYGYYWLVLARKYYEKEQYRECIRCIDKYDSMKVDTFRYDKEYAKTLAFGLAAADEAFSGDKYIEVAHSYLEGICNNTESEDWALKYLAAEEYMNLYNTTGEKRDLLKAYDLAKENVNYLIDRQVELNHAYLDDVKTIKAEKSDTAAKKKEIKQYNKWVQEERKKELPPVYQPLVMNTQLLYGLADKLQKPESEKQFLNALFYDEENPVFLVKQLATLYCPVDDETDTKEIVFDGKKIEIPACYLCLGTTVKVSVKSGDKPIVYDDWKLDEVKRTDDKDVSDFIATYSSKKIAKQKYGDGAIVEITIAPPEEGAYSPLEFKFEGQQKKKLLVLNDITFHEVK